MRHLLVTNDYPPKVGGIQSYLWEIYRRLPQDKVVVYTTPHPDSESFDQQQTHKIIRSKQRVLLPTKQVANQIRSVAKDEDIDFIEEVHKTCPPEVYAKSFFDQCAKEIGHHAIKEGLDFTLPPVSSEGRGAKALTASRDPDTGEIQF